MLIGMNNSSGAYCLMCMSRRSQFNCDHNTALTLRTKEKLANCLEEYLVLVANATLKEKEPPANVEGVNSSGLWDINPQRIVIPILHCPMGLVDKVLETFKLWVNMDVEDFHDADTEAGRTVYKLTMNQHRAAIIAHQEAKDLLEANPGNAQLKSMLKGANDVRIKAKKAEVKAKDKYNELVQRHNARKHSLNQQFEEVYRNNGIKRESYHGGKFNGVHCIRIMERADEIVMGTVDSPGFLQKCLLSRTPSATEDYVRSTCQQYARLLGLLDAIWSNVRGIDSGLLPTAEQCNTLETALAEGKALWLLMKLTTLQPKWHLTFDGHLLWQVKTYGGLADKSDESIEKVHQLLKQLRDRYRGIPSYEMKETCIRRELRRMRSPEIKQVVDSYERMIQQASGTKRATDTSERQDNKKKAKQEKREAYIVGL